MAALNVPTTSHGAMRRQALPQIVIPPFNFNNGQQARTAIELVLLCEMFALEGVDHLLSGRVECWLSEIGRTDLAAVAARARLNNGSVASRLDQFLRGTGLPLQADLMIHERRIAGRSRRQMESEASRRALDEQMRRETEANRQTPEPLPEVVQPAEQVVRLLD
ncbi:MAG TPA: hypothetical protein PKM21_07220 [Anaerolineales bacterium]|nr:hypothetical protein [Anaerolineales bacterium]